VNRIASLIKKEFLQIRRDRPMMMLIFFAPVLQLIILGYVVSSEIKNIPTVICDLDHSTYSRQIAERIQTSGYLNVKYYEPRPQNIRSYLDYGRASVAIVIPDNLSRDIRRNQPVHVQVLIDGQDANTTAIVFSHLNGILRQFLSEQIAVQAQLMDPSTIPHMFNTETRVWYNPDLKNSDFMVPGIAIFLLTIVTALLSAMGLVRERETGTMEQLLVTPIKKYQLLIGKIIPFAILGFIELTIALAFAKLWYKIPIVGNLGLFAAFTVVYLFTTLGVGLLISAISHTQMQAMFTIWFVLIFTFLMSGFIFPIENMPMVAQALTYLNPMRYFLTVIREIFLKGATIKELYMQGVAMVIFSATIFTFAVFRFQQRIK
jgi:ABC-2 type transport system permease protein